MSGVVDNLTLPHRHRPVPRYSAAYRLAALLAAAALLVTAGCIDDMSDQPKKEPLEGSTVFANGMASRPVVPGTVARGQLRIDRAFYEGLVDGKPVKSFPLPVTDELLHRGQQRFDIYCSPCHGRVGTGQGMVVQRGFPAPPSYHSQRLRDAPVGHFYDVITNGFGRMYDYASEVPPRDRWAIIAYIRVLQLSQNVPRDSVKLTTDEEAQLAGSGEAVGEDAKLLNVPASVKAKTQEVKLPDEAPPPSSDSRQSSPETPSP